MFKNTFGKHKNKNYDEIQYKCVVRYLDDNDPVTVSYEKETKGQYLIDHVCKELNLVEKDYFGLRYVDTEKQRHWLEPLKSVHKQLKNVDPAVLCFRVKFYPSETMKIHEELTRYFLFLQLRRDLHHGRLLCGASEANVLAAYIIQAEVGDWGDIDGKESAKYISEFKMLPKQTAKQEEKICEIHKTLVGQVPAVAEKHFLKKAVTLDTYGVDPHPVKPLVPPRKDQKGNQMYLGITHLGIVTFQGNKRTHLFKWTQINKIAFEGKMFIVHVTITEDLQQGDINSLTYKKKKHACGFKCPTFSACKHLWKCAIQQQYFFTLNASADAPKVTSGGGLFTRGSKYRFSGRCQKEVFIESALIRRDAPEFTRPVEARSVSNPQFVRTINNKLKSNTLPHNMKNAPNNVLIENNHHSMSALPLKADSISEKLDDSIPEEPRVISTDEYNPNLESPSGGEKLITSDRNIDESAVKPSKLDEMFKPNNLDAEIQKLEVELDVLKSTPPTKDTGLPPAVSEISDDVKNSAVNQPNKKKSALRSCCSILTSVVIALLLMLFVGGILILETDLNLPVVSTIRSTPGVDQFRALYYDPMRLRVTSYVSHLQNKIQRK